MKSEDRKPSSANASGNTKPDYECGVFALRIVLRLVRIQLQYESSKKKEEVEKLEVDKALDQLIAESKKGDACLKDWKSAYSATLMLFKGRCLPRF